MTEVQISTFKGGTIALSNDILTALQSGLQGSLCLPDEAGYDEARTIWNAMIDRRPGAVVRCRVANDVIGAVRLARDNGLLVAVRGGGHNIAGNAICDGGLLIDLSPMRSVHIDSLQPDIIVTTGSGGVGPLQQATRTLPIVANECGASACL